MTLPTPPADRTAVLTETLEQCALAARRHTLPRFRTTLDIENKFERGFDPVTAADREAETAIRQAISARFPDHGIIGEEWDAVVTDSPYQWIIDPIDGTRAFIAGVPVWGTLIGLMENGRAIAGLMEQPFTGERWLAIEGHLHATRNGDPLASGVSSATKLSHARTSTTAPELFTGAHAQGWAAIQERVLVTRYGLDCYAYCLLASGHLDLVVEAGLKDVDIAPLIPIIEAAGGVVTTWDGGRAEEGGTCVAAATPQLHAEALSVLRDAML